MTRVICKYSFCVYEKYSQYYINFDKFVNGIERR